MRECGRRGVSGRDHVSKDCRGVQNDPNIPHVSPGRRHSCKHFVPNGFVRGWCCDFFRKAPIRYMLPALLMSDSLDLFPTGDTRVWQTPTPPSPSSWKGTTLYMFECLKTLRQVHVKVTHATKPDVASHAALGCLVVLGAVSGDSCLGCFSPRSSFLVEAAACLSSCVSAACVPEVWYRYTL